MLSIDYTNWGYYDQTKLEHDWYSVEDRQKLFNAFDSIEDSDLEELCTAFILETSTRNSEARAVRFSDFHFDSQIPYVYICGMSSGGRREDRVKADSNAGKRPIPITPRLNLIFEKAKKLSWSETFLFVQGKDKWDGKDDGVIRSQGLQRGLKRICELADVNYLPPHQLRFSDATIMALNGSSEFEIQKRLGHTTPEMASHYVRNANNMVPASGPNWTTVFQAKKNPTTIE